VIGAGIMGLATAFEMAKLGVEDIVVVEKGYLCSGASGRNGGGVRAQWSSEENVRLMKESIRLCREFATKMRINVWFRQGGYLFLARSEAMAERLDASARLQRDHGLPTRMIDPAECKKLVPELDASRIVAASHNPDDGVVFPWPFVWGYARACEELGVPIHTFTTVTELETDGRRITAVVTDRGRIRTPLVINATGAWSPEIARLVDLELPNHPHRHEICSTEPLKPFLKPFVGDLESGLYCSQSMRGELVGGISNPLVPEGLDQESSLRFLALYARALTRTMPILGGVRVLRQWSGCYDITPDGSPIVGPVDDVEGFVQICGFMGHGFMIAPIMGLLMARYLTEQPDADHALFDKWNLRRFREGRLLSETMILG
jgi:sarcosine oxidase subunit beta